MDKDGVAAFLRSRRDALSPRDLGLGDGARRRAPGLRREEVAELAGMSTDYYARLEQRRAPRPSVQIANALARALRLEAVERDHLFVLLGHERPARLGTSGSLDAALASAVDSITDVPCFAQTDLLETLAMNPLARALLGDLTRFDGLARSACYRWFTDPRERSSYPVAAHERHGRDHVARLRDARTSGSVPAHAERIRQRLAEESAEFRTMWERQEVARQFDDCTVLLHPVLGEIEVEAQLLFTEDRGQSLVILNPRPGTPSRAQLDRLLSDARAAARD
ncbi:helix-turn-helix transcriptional regulator [Curtobacterium sp. MCPF17_021]|uniref:helix-turn-helix transcriptional regulator n=1 Tax=Curtobacterium sp. MCPF17_021 TaxID=2175639 RepID=UPI000DA81091|nr:helix-turn-helix transcriptional regulator [Curtobacterium sp. MCPF17_021]WIE82394.1 helix-turn-helix transcriptional regulator [Curtobacterium sp. MCPF17_021]